MKILDRYVAKNFLIGYGISFCVLIGLRVIIDLFVNLDEFTEHAGLGTLVVLRNIFVFYGLNCTLYFRDFAGMIMVVAAAFSLGRMIKGNELVAMMASGVSLKRVMAPIVVLSMLLTVVLIIDQEFLIPPLSDKLVLSHDAIPGQETYDAHFLIDGNGSLISSYKFDVRTSTLYNPTIVTRRKQPGSILWDVTGWIDAEKGVYDYEKEAWVLTNGQLRKVSEDFSEGVQAIESYASDVGPRDIPVRRKSEYKTLLSWRQLSELSLAGAKIKDMAQLQSQKHFRITEPIINLVMLMVCLPILVCRDPKSMKSAIAISFGVTAAFLVTIFMSKMFAAEVMFNRVIPELWAWLPIFLFLPVAVVELDSMRT